MGAYEDKVINGILAHSEPVGPQTHPVVISPFPKCIIGINIHISW